MNSVLTHIDWNMIASFIFAFMVLIFIVDIIILTVTKVDIDTIMSIDLVVLVLVAIFINVQIRTATDNFKNEDLVIAQNFTLSKSTVTPDVKKKSWSEIDAYVVFKNSENAAGEADLKADFGVVDDDGYVVETDQYVGYHTSETFTLEKFNELMTRFVEQLNELTLVKYDIKLPEDKYSCAIISKSVS